ncbi:hypothetical protein V1281_002864 [Nitrobacteraceae bacterium AZCC 2161]
MIHPRTPVIHRLRVQPDEAAQETAKGPPAIVGSWPSARDEAIRAALKEMRRGGVELDLIPQPALDLLIDAHTPPEDHPALRPRGSRRGVTCFTLPPAGRGIAYGFLLHIAQPNDLDSEDIS